MGKGIIKLDVTDTNEALGIMHENKDAFPFDTSPQEGSKKGITSGAVAEAVKDIKSKAKGYFLTEERLRNAYPEADEGSKAYVGNNYPYAIYLYDTEKGGWYDTEQTGGDEQFNAGEFYTKIQIDEKMTAVTERVDILESQEIFLSQDAYDSLEPEQDKVYFIYEEE
ncbi:hypothetical protein [Phocaeicola plebeius]|uniref:hypothetical protein n=1 Tax=Phocaeicola plebeius TaxID=310297 RepID=UPI0029435FB9|nr:hypothetical protein [Phocaeicola plebeius]